MYIAYLLYAQINAGVTGGEAEWGGGMAARCIVAFVGPIVG